MNEWAMVPIAASHTIQRFMDSWIEIMLD